MSSLAIQGAFHSSGPFPRARPFQNPYAGPERPEFSVRCGSLAVARQPRVATSGGNARVAKSGMEFTEPSPSECGDARCRAFRIGSGFAARVDVIAKAPGLLDSPPKARVHALFTRIQLLEQHALTLETAFRTEAMKADVRAVISTLHRAEAWLGAAAPHADVVTELEDLLGSVSQQISGLGRAK